MWPIEKDASPQNAVYLIEMQFLLVPYSETSTNKKVINKIYQLVYQFSKPSITPDHLYMAYVLFTQICLPPFSGQVDRASATETINSDAIPGRVKPKV